MSSSALKRWRSKCDKKCQKFKKDYCECCGRTGVGLTLHHFKFKSQFPHLRHRKNNLITICQKCHSALHHGGKREEMEQNITNYRGQDWRDELEKEAKKDMGSGWLTAEWYKGEYYKLKNN